ncbi:cell division protein FtsI/penicillin-binding protein 2 [Aminobacter aganoensis]|uniref:Cell division protein FtsI/penicillin-binding protein 2 n=1 Tax=Aminobacter aganoensis TaxID=83264 RepID=A0A7X0KM72_9HYPH|nr:cell division protein FtsI/penicillin-binding protein 2 [Aminobacter aganoensis]
MKVAKAKSLWRPRHSITAAFGYGFSTTPLQTAAGAAALMNGGRPVPPTFLPRTIEEANALSERVVSAKTSDDMRYLYNVNATAPGGSGKGGAVLGYRVGGKTGTAEKVVGGRYSKDRNFNVFLAAFPIEDTKYVILTIVDEPKLQGSSRAATAGVSAAPMAANIIRRAATMLGVTPDFTLQ